ncbi:MAG: hypothetical protein ACTHK8_21545 [Ginsengibacter sp.]
MNEPGVITLIPTSGLGNRLRIMATAMKLAREGNKKLRIYWNTNSELNAPFDKLFEYPLHFSVKPVPIEYKVWIEMRRFSSKLFGFEDWYLNLFKFDFIFLDRMVTDVLQNRLNLQEEVNKAHNVFICSCEELNYCDLSDYEVFKPVTAIQKKIDNLALQFNASTIGIHIRSTDHFTSIENSPFILFENKIDEELRSNPEANFFLATDNEEHQYRLVQKFGKDKILFHKKIFRRDVTEGVADAVVDLFCLSKTSKIYGSYYSSFSYVAGRIGQVPVDILTVDGLPITYLSHGNH